MRWLCFQAGTTLAHPHSNLAKDTPAAFRVSSQVRAPDAHTALEATQGQMDGFFSQLPYRCYLEEVASVEN